MTEAKVARDFDRWLNGRSLSGRGYSLLASVPGMMLINTPVFRLDRELVLKPEQRLLDVGCGRGSLLQVLASRVPFQTPPLGLDIVASLLRRARVDARRGSSPPIELAQGSATRLPIAGDSVDIVTCAYLVKHLDDAGLTRFLQELLRVLRPGAFAVLWEFAATASARLDAWHRWVLTRGVESCNLRGYAALAAAATAAGFDWVDNAHLRPFIFPPIPRVSVILGKAPESWREQTGPGRARRAALTSRQSGESP